jgi:quercetin dioxygenase-like cupin family protein
MERRGLKPTRILALVLVLVVGLVLGTLSTQGLRAQQPQLTRTVLLKAEKLTGIPGMEAYVMDVTIAPGGQTGWHMHPGHEFGAVLEGEEGGTLEVQGQPTTVFKKGMAYHVDPMVPHNGTNNSKTAPVRLSVFFLVESGKPLQTSVPAPASALRGDY